MERKLPYEEAQMNVIFIEETDIITVSRPDGGGSLGGSTDVDDNGWTNIGGSWW